MDKSIQKGNALKRNTGITIIIVFVLSLIPLLLISKYAHSSADDYAYGLLTAQAWMKTHSVFETLLSAGQQAQTSYATWQGTLSATFLMALQPAAFGEKYYILTPIILMFSYMIATLLFLKVLLVNYMKADQYNFASISFLILILSIQFMYSPVEGFFWYNGGIYYTFFYSLSLILFSLILLYLKSKNLFAKILYLFFSMILGLFIGAGNYTTALTTALILFLSLLIT